ncbi:MAG TPA: ABC transporter permease [Pyrinomonadaceae bacterium]|nr:ABC transporter permease [Pyrinomonadaceae bacterium]
MKKFLAVVKREYVQRVRTRMFIVLTVLGPFMLILFAIVPGLLFHLPGGTTRLAVIDETRDTKLYERFRSALADRSDLGDRPDLASSLNSNTRERVEQAGSSLRGGFSIERVELTGRPLEEVRQELNRRIAAKELDGYLVLPADILQNPESKPSYYGRNVGDVITSNQLQEKLNLAVNRQRLTLAGVDEERLNALSQPLELETYPVNEKGEEGERDSGGGFLMVFLVGFAIYLTILMYGQVILGAIVEEKETRIAEILFSSINSFPLMMGKLIGVSLVALTQLAIWGGTFVVVTGWLLGASGVEGLNVPHLPPLFAVYFLLFFLLGYFLYASLYALIGSMVTTTQEGGQLAMPVVLLLLFGFYLAFPVIRSPSSPLAFWVSLVPFFAPITMIIRIVSQTPPLWEIALSLFIGLVTVVAFLWLTARIYRVGMLMYGKRASILEVVRWLKHS